MPNILHIIKTGFHHQLAKWIIKNEDLMPYELREWAYRWYREH